jgi:ubiquinone/menaquinone biosynthesis C-methylase UbiE
MPKQENIPIPRKSEKSELLDRGLFILNRLGLNIDDLKDKKILDIGSGQAPLEFLLKQHGINNIISIEKRLPWMSSDKELNQVNAKAESLPIRDGDIDLIITHAGPPTTSRWKKYNEDKEILNNEEKRIESYFDEFKRVLSKNGEARIAPTHLWFIYINNLNRIFQGKNKLNSSEQEALDIITEEQSTNYLQKKYNISLHDNNLEKNDKNFSKYWVMKKE